MKKIYLGILILSLTACELPQSNSTTESTPTQAQTQTQTQPTQAETPILNNVVSAVTTNEQKLTLEVVQDQASREQGLMNRESLDPNTGMLFVFDEIDNHGFWMKNTLIPLDIIWLSKNQQVLHYVQAEPCVTKNCTVYKPGPNAKAKYVIELNAGTFTGKLGDYINF